VTVLRIGHVNLRGPAALIEQLKDFYVDVIGLRAGPRPTFRSGSSGYWLYAGNLDVIHLSIDPHRTTMPEVPHAGFGHFALLCNRADFDAARQRLDALGANYTVDQIEELGQIQIFLTDPAGTSVELTFAR
jgi:catechol 2,3-dioxygenase-like lactoylglutathione lyase family enzyme